MDVVKELDGHASALRSAGLPGDADALAALASAVCARAASLDRDVSAFCAARRGEALPE
jgi:hypothetical protein